MCPEDAKPMEFPIPERGGYEKLAKWMSIHPELAVFRRFGALYTESILLMQAEITQIEQELQHVRDEDKKSGDVDRQLQGMSWAHIVSTCSAEEDSPERKQYDIIMKLRELLPQYCESMAANWSTQTEVSRPSGPSPQTVELTFVIPKSN